MTKCTLVHEEEANDAGAPLFEFYEEKAYSKKNKQKPLEV